MTSAVLEKTIRLPRALFQVLLWSLVGGVALESGKANGPSVPAKEYQIKAAFLYNFTQFAEWPPQTFAGPESPFVLGVLGDDPFGPALDQIVRGEKVHSHPIIVERYRSVAEIKVCHMLFISESENQRLEDVFAALKGRSVLTVGDIEGFAKRGGMIRFLTERNKIRFRVNLEAAKAGGLTISSKLLRAAEITASGKD